MGLFSRKKKEDKKDIQNASDAQAQAVGREKGVGEVKPSIIVGDVSIFHAIREPHVTEKSSMLNSAGKYVFKVRRRANKADIKRAVQNLYKVSVVKVNIVNIPAKSRRVGKHFGQRAGFKKAIVTLKQGDRIDIAA